MSISETETSERHEIKMTTGRKGRSSPRKGGGASDPVVLIEFVARIENLNDEIAKEKSAFMLTCKALQQDIKEVLEQAQEKGLPKKPLKAIVKQRALEKKAIACRDALDEPDYITAFDIMKNALGDLGGSPLGDFAMQSAH